MNSANKIKVYDVISYVVDQDWNLIEIALEAFKRSVDRYWSILVSSAGHKCVKDEHLLAIHGGFVLIAVSVVCNRGSLFPKAQTYVLDIAVDRDLYTNKQ